MTANSNPDVVTVTLNPAIDQTVTIPNFAAGKVNRVEQIQWHPGGKGVNVAAALADYGHEVAVTGFLGRDNSGAFEVLFAQKHIEDRFLRIAGQTRIGVKITDPLQQQTTDVNFPGPAPTTSDIAELLQQLASLAAVNCRWFVLAGSLPPGVDLGIYRDIITALKRTGCSVLLDTSGEALQQALPAAPRILKPNIHELETLVGASLPTESDVVDAARKLIDRGVNLVAVSMGAQGSCFVSADAVVIARPPKVQVKSTVGAGDAMVAGIVASQLAGLPLAECARLATAFSLDALTRVESGLGSPAAIRAAREQVAIEQWVPHKA